MPKYFIVANSFVAPFVSDTSFEYVTAKSPEDGMEKFKKRYKHPCGLYAANLYENADAYHQNKKPLVIFRSEKAIEKEK